MTKHKPYVWDAVLCNMMRAYLSVIQHQIDKDSGSEAQRVRKTWFTIQTRYVSAYI